MDPKEINELPLKIARGHIANRRRCCSGKDRQEKGLIRAATRMSAVAFTGWMP